MLWKVLYQVYLKKKKKKKKGISKERETEERHNAFKTQIKHSILPTKVQGLLLLLFFPVWQNKNFIKKEKRMEYNEEEASSKMKQKQ